MLRTWRAIFSLIAIGAFGALSNAAPPAAKYELVDIGALTPLSYSSGFAVSNSGYVVGLTSNGTTFQQGFIWHEGTGVRLLNLLSGSTEAVASKVNDAGQALGTSFDPTNGVLWNADASVTHVFQSAAIDQPTGLNNAGLVTGYRNTPGGGQSAYVWNGSYTDLGFPAPAISSQGYDINDVGQVAGVFNGGQAYGAFASAPGAFLWSQAVGFTTIVTSSAFAAIDVRDLSNQGVIVGGGQWNGGANWIGWRWDASGGYSPLSSLPGSQVSEAYAVNASGLIAGVSGGFGTLWDQEGNIFKANDLLAPDFFSWNVSSLWGINDNGWLTGYAFQSGSPFHHAVLLRPIPEPASSGFIAFSFITLIARRRQKPKVSRATKILAASAATNG
jgi:hypothetical protein